MAKKQNELQFGQVPLPQALKQYSLSKLNWSGLNRRQVIDTGALSMECNISTAEAPYLTPSQSRVDILSDMGLEYKHPISLFSFDDFLVVIYRDDTELKLDYLVLSDKKNSKGQITKVYTGLIKKGVTEETDAIQRSMVQFNVYENAVDVLGGTYVKKLILFPDKVSMFMKIVDTDKDPTTFDKQAVKDGNADIDVMYCQKESSGKKTYYVWNGAIGRFTLTGGVNYFKTSNLDVEIKKYYNDGYTQTKDEYYNDGYRKSSKQTYNDGYKKTEYNKDGSKKARFYDGYQKQWSGSYNENDGIVYYQRQGTCSPYTYITVTDLKNGDSVAGLYIRAFSPLKQMTNVAFYERTGTSFPYTYTRVYAELDYNSDISNYYEKVSDSTGTVQTKLYVRKADDNGTIIPYEYEEVTDIAYGTNITDYYEKISDKEVTAKAYYKRTENTDKDSDDKYKYELIKNLENGKKVSEYYEFTENYAPPEGSNKSCYWLNTYDNQTYQFCSDIGGGKSGFGITVSPSFPNLKYAVVHLSRLFGVDEDRVHVSGYNDYTNWNLDTVAESNDSNAWSSASQTNTKAGGNFTGITVYDNHVVCFKRDFMHEIYNSKNPFRLVDVYAEGSIDNRSIQEVNGKLIFASDDEIKVYTGSQPREIGYNLGIDEFKSAVSGSDGRNYYLYCTDRQGEMYLFVYDTMVGQWSQQAIKSEV